MAKEVIKEVKEVSFELPNEIVYLKFLPRKKGMAANVPEDHIIAGGMLGEAVRKYRAPLQRSGAIQNVLTKEEKEFLEKKTGLDLSVYGDFWVDFSVTLRKDVANNRLDLSNPMDYMSLKLLQALKDEIAPSWDRRNDKLTYDFAIVRGNEEQAEKKKQYDSKKEAFKQYGKIETDRNKLIGVLKLLSNKPISVDSTVDWLQGQVEGYVDDMPTAFLDIINDASFDTKCLINKGIDFGVIIRRGNKYSTVDGLELCEADEVPTFVNAVRYLENPRNQEILLLIEAKINNAK